MLFQFLFLQSCFEMTVKIHSSKTNKTFICNMFLQLVRKQNLNFKKQYIIIIIKYLFYYCFFYRKRSILKKNGESS